MHERVAHFHFTIVAPCRPDTVQATPSDVLLAILYCYDDGLWLHCRNIGTICSEAWSLRSEFSLQDLASRQDLGLVRLASRKDVGTTGLLQCGL